MPIVSSKGLAAYTGTFGPKEVKHLLRRIKFGINRQDLITYNGMNLNQVLSSILVLTPEPAPPLNHYESIKKPVFLWEIPGSIQHLSFLKLIFKK